MHVLIVYHPTSAAGLGEILASRPDGVRTSIAFRASVATAHPAVVRVAELAGATVVLPDDAEDVVSAPGDWYLTFADCELEYVDLINARIEGVASSDEGSWNKLTQRRLLASAAGARVSFRHAAGVMDLPVAAAQVGYPVVIKPQRGANGDGVYRVDSAAALHELIRSASLQGPILVEAAIESVEAHPRCPWMGSLFSVEMSSDSSGVHTPLAVFGKLPVETPGTACDGVSRLRVCGDVYPSGLSGSEEEMLVEATASALSALAVRRRVTHTELLLTAAGPEVVEVNGRMGGFLARLLRTTSSVDLVGATLKTAAALPVVTSRGTSGVAAGYFPTVSPTGPIVRSRVRLRDLREIRGVVAVDARAREGDRWAAIDDRPANVVLAAPTHRDLAEVLGGAATTLRRLYRPDLRRAGDSA
jgi:biotin carboxylase